MKRVLLVLLLAGCGRQAPTETSELATNELSLQLLVETDEEATTLTIGIYALGEDRYTRLSLGSGDRLVARVGDRTFEARRADLGVTSYAVKVPITEGTLELDFLREGKTSARGTHIDLPPAFTLAKPTGDGLVHLQQPFTMSWSPVVATSSMRAKLHGTCVSTAERTLAADTGTFTWSVADFGHGAEPPPCTATITLSRPGGTASIAPELAGVQLFRAEQVRAIGLWAVSP